MTSRRPHLWTFFPVFLGLICLAVTAYAQPQDAHYAVYRQKLMQSVGGNMAAIGVTLKTKLPYQKHIATHAAAIQTSSTMIEAAFKKEVTEGKTDAKPDIWKDWDKFTEAAKKMGEEAGKLAKVAESDDMAAIGAQVKALGKACGGCHKPFRKPKEERFKR